MQRKCDRPHFILASVVLLILTTLMISVDAQAQIAFVSNRSGNWDIYVMDADGGNPRNLTKSRHNDWHPSWSPDGEQIAFGSNREGNLEIYVMDADGGNPRNLTKSRHDDWHPSWSSDGTRIAFVSNRVGNWEIYVMDAGGNPRNLTKSRHDDSSPSWSPDGKHIAFTSDRGDDPEDTDIYMADIDGQKLQNLTQNFDLRSEEPSWSPDGKHIAFDAGSDRVGSEIYVMDANGQNKTHRQ